MRLHDREVRTIYDVLDVVRVRPGMWIGHASVHLLQVFLAGFRAGIDAAGQQLAPEAPPFQEFHAWIAARLGVRLSGRGWADMLAGADDEAAAFVRFWTELDEYRRSAATAG